MSTKSHVKRLLDEARTKSSDDTDGRTMSPDEVKDAVREGVAEAMAERDRAQSAGDTGSDTDVGDEAPPDTSRGFSLKKALALTGFAYVVYRVRRRRGTTEDDESE